MVSLHQHVLANKAGSDHIVGDLHVCLDLLQIELGRIGFDRMKDRLFSVGDPTQMARLISVLFGGLIKVYGEVPMLGSVLELWRLLLRVSSPNADSTFIRRSKLKALLGRRVFSADVPR